MSARRKTLVALLVCAAAGSGCGGEDTERASEPTKASPTPAAEEQVDEIADEAAINTLIESYLAAVAGGDGKRACAALTADVQDQVAKRAEQLGTTGDCEEVVAKLGDLLSSADKRKLSAAKVTDVSVKGGAATASSTGMTSTVQLVREGGEWRISALPPPNQGGEDESGATLPSDGCSLLSDRQVAEVLGGRASRRSNSGVMISLDARYVQCIWQVKKGGLVDEKLTVVLVDSPERYEELARDPDAEPVKGVGDAAVAFTGGPRFDLAEDDDFGPDGIDTERVIVVQAGERTLLVELNPIEVRDPADLKRRISNRRLATVAREVLKAV